MSEATLALGEGYDLGAALKKLEHYCRATGSPAHLVDAEGKPLGGFDSAGKPAGAAELLAGCCPAGVFLDRGREGDEIRAQLFAAYQAERFGGTYIQLCPHSLLMWAAPLIVDGVMAAAFIGGPVMVVDPAELVEEYADAGRIDPVMKDALRDSLDRAQRVVPDQATSLAEILADLSISVAVRSADRARSAPFAARRERDEQEARISEYLHDLKRAERDSEAVHSYPIEKERELLMTISRGDKAESQRLLNEILGYVFFSTGKSPAVVKARVLELVVLLSRAALEGGADAEQIFGLNFTYLDQVQKMRSVDDIAYWLSRIMARFTDLVFDLKDVKHADVMQRALKLINRRYTENLTLDEVAGAVFLSPTYFSKLFNEEMKCRFTTYLNRLRIEKSRHLLRNTDIPLVGVAGLVGYEDQSYFTKVFKKMVGMSPGRYRESGGHAPGNQEIHDA